MANLIGSHNAAGRSKICCLFLIVSFGGKEPALLVDGPMDVGCGKCILTIYVHRNGFATHTHIRAKCLG